MKRKRKIKSLVYVLLTLFLLLVTIISGRGKLSAFAYTSGHTGVLEDLQKDSSFNFMDYPEINNDYSIQVIQIAESTNKELYVYTYQPCQASREIVATDINMSLNETVDGTEFYGLELLNTWGVFAKYLVNGVKVSSAATRYYNITSIYREWINDIDKGTDNSNIVNGKVYGVGQYWQATTLGDTVTYKMLKVDTVEIINPFTSYIRRNKNQSSNGYFQDNYYVAFSTDRNIDELLSATVKYRIQDYFYKANNVLGFDNTEFWNYSTFSNEKRTKKEVYCDEVTELYQDGFNLFGLDFNKKFSWERIQSSADFVKNAGASSSDNDEVKKLQWVLMFDEASVYRYQSGGLLARYEEAGQIIDEVTILRLEFVEDGRTYNLGAVSDMVSKDHDFSDKNDGMGENPFQWLIDLFKQLLNAPWWVWLLVVVGVIAVISIVVSIVKWGVKSVIKGIFSALLFVITAPFKFIAWLIRKIKGDD